MPTVQQQPQRPSCRANHLRSILIAAILHLASSLCAACSRFEEKQSRSNTSGLSLLCFEKNVQKYQWLTPFARCLLRKMRAHTKTERNYLKWSQIQLSMKLEDWTIELHSSGQLRNKRPVMTCRHVPPFTSNAMASAAALSDWPDQPKRLNKHSKNNCIYKKQTSRSLQNQSRQTAPDLSQLFHMFQVH